MKGLGAAVTLTSYFCQWTQRKYVRAVAILHSSTSLIFGVYPDISERAAAGGTIDASITAIVPITAIVLVVDLPS
jgi:hypothetical protein